MALFFIIKNITEVDNVYIRGMKSSIHHRSNLKYKPVIDVSYCPSIYKGLRRNIFYLYSDLDWSKKKKLSPRNLFHNSVHFLVFGSYLVPHCMPYLEAGGFL